MSKKPFRFFVMKSVTTPFSYIGDHMISFLTLSVLFSSVLTLLSYFFGFTITCSSTGKLDGFCSEFNHMYFVYAGLKFLILSVFVSLWCAVSFKNVSLDEKYVLTHGLSYLRTAAVIVFVVLLSLIPLVCINFMLARVPNPDWRIELAYFTVLSVGSLIPIFLMRFYGLVADLIESGKFTNAKQIWKNSSGKTLKILFASSCVYFVCLCLVLSVLSSVKSTERVSILQDLYNEFLFNFMTLFCFALVFSFYAGQRSLLMEEK